MWLIKKSSKVGSIKVFFVSVNIPEVRGMTHEVRGMTHEVRGMMHEVRGMMHEVRGMIHEVRGMIHEVRGMINEVRGMIHEVRGMIHEVRGMTHEVRGMIHEVHGTTHEVYGMTHEVRTYITHGSNGFMVSYVVFYVFSFIPPRPTATPRRGELAADGLQTLFIYNYLVQLLVPTCLFSVTVG